MRKFFTIQAVKMINWKLLFSGGLHVKLQRLVLYESVIDDVIGSFSGYPLPHLP